MRAEVQQAETTLRTESPIATPDRTMSLSINDLQHLATMTAVPPWGTQEIASLSEDLLLVRSDVHSNRLCETHGALFEIDTRGWLYFHFRLDGISVDRLPGGPTRTVSGGSFLICSSPGPSAMARQVLSDTWQVVSIACRPSEMLANLPVSGAFLPEDLRRFRAGDPDVDFFYTSRFTPEMRLAAGALLKPVVNGGMRPYYLQAKTVELVCLAVEHVGRPAALTEPPLKLSHRDVLALEHIKCFIEQADRNYSLEQLARRAGVNRRKLALGFKLLFGVPVAEYQREVRLEFARRSLNERKVSVAYAASVAGYSDVGSFGKAFKARFGALPSQCKGTADRLLAQNSHAGTNSR